MEKYSDFNDCEELSLSDSDLGILERLYNLSKQAGIAHAAVVKDDELLTVLTNGLSDRVYIPESIRNMEHLRLFHSHTIETPLSPSDLSLLIAPGVDEVCVITKNRSIFRVMVNGGIKPEEEEYIEKTDGLDDEVNFDVMEYSDFYEWTYELRNYVATKEQMFRTVRLFRWRLEGGRI